MGDDFFNAQSIWDWLVVFDPKQRIFVLYLVSALVLAFFAYLTVERAEAAEKGEASGKAGGFFKYAFSRDIYGHRSSVQDYLIALLNFGIYYVLLAQFLIGSTVFSTVTHRLLEGGFGPLEAPVLQGFYAKALYTAVAIVAVDFALYLQHYAMHKLPILWHFHKVHHSAEVMTPMTLFRMHPVDLAFAAIMGSLFGGLAYGLFWYLSGQVPQDYTVLGVNIVLFLFYLAGYNLRHSHIWLAYPRWLSHIFVSPAQHQIHHSTAREHFDKNMGLVFSLWDWLFKTLHVPAGREKITYGISKAQPNPFNSMTEMYLMPFKWSWKSLKNKKERDSFVNLLLVLAVVVIGFSFMYQAIMARALPSVRIEELTWYEIKTAMDRDGYDTVIIPVGGTEQNGAHEIIGKHNYIVAYTTEKIARRIGRALVAPVLSYVPEGAIDNPNHHMALPGTLTVPDDAFEGTIGGAAESYIHHGFKYIFFIGDSGDNQAQQQAEADRLSAKYAGKGVTIAQIGDYYAKNGQFDWLLAQGYTAQQIGQHAGIRDTSELMAIRPSGIRPRPPGSPGTMGNNGDYRLASKAIGEKMLQLKIDAGVKQIESYLKDRKAVPGPRTLTPAKNPE